MQISSIQAARLLFGFRSTHTFQAAVRNGRSVQSQSWENSRRSSTSGRHMKPEISLLAFVLRAPHGSSTRSQSRTDCSTHHGVAGHILSVKTCFAVLSRDSLGRVQCAETMVTTFSCCWIWRMSSTQNWLQQQQKLTAWQLTWLHATCAGAKPSPATRQGCIVSQSCPAVRY